MLSINVLFKSLKVTPLLISSSAANSHTPKYDIARGPSKGSILPKTGKLTLVGPDPEKI